MVKVCVYKGLTLNLYLFSLVMDEPTKRVQDEAAWRMMFADNTILVYKNTNGLEGKLERWWDVLEKNGLI